MDEMTRVSIDILDIYRTKDELRALLETLGPIGDPKLKYICVYDIFIQLETMIEEIENDRLVQVGNRYVPVNRHGEPVLKGKIA